MQSLLDAVSAPWHVVAGILTVLLSAVASAHVILSKSDSRSAVGWVGLIWFAPVIGAVLYWMLGINRVRRRAAAGRRVLPMLTGEFKLPTNPPLAVAPPVETERLASLARLLDGIAGRSLTLGNRVTPLLNGDEAFPAMLEAIEGAQHTVGLATYIFDNDHAGNLFLAALERAVRRGVQVRVLVDAVGARYSWPPITRELRRRGIRTARFGPTYLPWRWAYTNLRNHRKILVVDGRTGFTGGMNIREGSLLDRRPPRPVQDLHFRLDGPVVRQLAQTFRADWRYTTHEALDGDGWFPELTEAGSVAARGISDGPDEDFDRARFTLLGALACAHTSVRIVTPYFLPDSGLITAINVAALRGVRVEIVLPETNNQILVQWASTAQLWQILARGGRVSYTSGPFDHTKLMTVDGTWSLFGSSNWDPRSLRLNFEFIVECYDRTLTEALDRLIDAKLANGRPVTLREVDSRPLPIRLRDGIARLAAPYL